MDNQNWSDDPLDQLNRVQPMTQMSRLLVERLLKEFKTYFNKTSEDEHICMFLNPFVLIFGMDYLVGQRILPKDLKDDCRKYVIKQALQYFGPDKQSLYKKIQEEHDGAEQAAAEQAAVRPGAPAITPGSPARKMGKIFKQMQKKLASQSTAAATPVSSLPIEEKKKYRFSEEQKKVEENVRDEIERYEEYFRDFIASVGEDGLLNDAKWREMVEEFPSPLGLKEIKKGTPDTVSKLWRDNFFPMDAVYSTKRFDIIGWWMNDAHGGKFKYLQALAVVHLSQPYTNALVERVFSRGTWIDSARSQRTLDTTFEMRVLDADNRRLVEMAKPVLDRNDELRLVITQQKIDDALSRFAVPLESSDDSDETATAYEEKDYAEMEEEVVVKVVGLDSEDSESEDEDDDCDADKQERTDDDADDDADKKADKQERTTIFEDMRTMEFHNEVNEVLKHLAASKKKPPPSSVKAKPSAGKSSSRKSV